ncbi:hypothetical protein WJX73_006870 [Symbiochloris irregularis]|uniref:Uncharacterized protein n=1 Tax=Symbiochloris irregularis TaxID=706552 RepID=A0AAW1NZN5_9CHLO
MQTTLALVFLAVLAGQQAAALDLGRSRKLLQENRIGDGAGNILDAAGRRRLLQGGGGAGAGGIASNVENDAVTDTNQDIGETNQLAGDTTSSFGVQNPANVPGVGNPGNTGNVGGGGGGGGQIVGAATKDATGDAQQTAGEGTQLVGDTTTNAQPATNPTGRRLQK